LLHEGPWSRVYRARPVSAGCGGDGPYAIKLPSGEPRDRLMAENMLRREARVLFDVQHPNLVALLGCRLRRPPFYLLTPYLEGATLGDVLYAKLRVPLRHALWVTRQAAQALHALHGAGWTHNDIKPENIHVATSGHATLFDLGMARRVDGRANRKKATAPGAITGTLKYTAPEWFHPAGSVDERSDIYSLGAVLHHLLAGHPPFAAPNAASLIEAHLHATPPELSLPRTPLATDVRELVRRMLAKDPLRRPDAGDLVRRLSRLEIAVMVEGAQAAA